MDTLAPSLLVAVPQMQDPNFARTVTLLIEAGPEGAFGLVVNRLSPVMLADICAQKDLPCAREMFVRVGGPSETDRAWVLHGPALREEGSFEVRPGVMLTPSWEMLGRLAQSKDTPFLVMLGYAGWGPGQLERELAEGAWLLSDVDENIIFNTRDTDMWRTVIHAMGLDPGHIAPGGGGVH